MHNAPTVDYPVGRSRFQAVSLFTVVLGGACVDWMWLSVADRLDWRHWLALMVSLGSAMTALYVWRNSHIGLLRWDGRSWCWVCKGVSVTGLINARLDLQGLLLLEFRPQSGLQRWFWLERSAARVHWSALRRAVYAPVSDDEVALQTIPAQEAAHPGALKS